MPKKFYLSLGLTLWLATVVFIAAPIWPHVFYRLSPQTSEALANTLSLPITAPSTSFAALAKNDPSPTPTSSIQDLRSPLPPLDLSLPKENGLIIESIGVRGQLHEGDKWEEILKKGLWHVPDFGNPEENTLPIIIAAHRWGYLSWTNSFRVLNSFYNLPKLKVGDKVDVVWNQRKYTYEIYASEEGEKITDYKANLILYTCQLWNSPIRIFKYARRIN